MDSRSLNSTHTSWKMRWGPNINHWDEECYFIKSIKKIVNNLKKINTLPDITRIFTSEYPEGYFLNMHIDNMNINKLTLTIVITDNYEGGTFYLNDKEYALEKGDGILYEGCNTLHGVDTVTKGERVALNFWFCY